MRAAPLLLALLVAGSFAGCNGETTPPSAECATKPSASNLPLSTPTNPVVIWNTTMGCFAVELYMGKAPVTAGNFLNLTKSGFYDGTRFHRVIAGFMIQDGDPYSKDLSKKSQWGTGDPGYDIADEFPCKDGFVSHSWPADCSAHGGQLYSHAKVGTLSMANSGRPHDGGSQYFVMVAGQPRTDLDPKHPIFGVVVWNMSVVEAISRTPTGESDRPLTDVVNRSLKVL